MRVDKKTMYGDVRSELAPLHGCVQLGFMLVYRLNHESGVYVEVATTAQT